MNRQHIFGDAFFWVRFNFLQEGGAAELHFSGDWSSGMKVPGYRNNELVMESMVDNKEKSLLGLAK